MATGEISERPKRASPQGDTRNLTSGSAVCPDAADGLGYSQPDRDVIRFA